MNDVTIQIPAAHVERIRAQVESCLVDEAETVSHWGGLADLLADEKERRFRDALEALVELKAGLDQLGERADRGECRLGLRADLLRVVIANAQEMVSALIGEVAPDTAEVRRLADEVDWFAGQLAVLGGDRVEYEVVAGAAV